MITRTSAPREAEGPVGLVLAQQTGVEEHLSVLVELRDSQSPSPPYKDVAVGQNLHVAGRISVLLVGVGVLAHQRGAHPLLVELQHDTAGLFYDLRDAIVKNRGAVVEDGDGAVSLAPGVVLEGESGARTHLEIALLPPKTPHDLARVAIYLVDGEGLASGDDQVIVVIYFYGVGVEVVEPRAPILRHRGIGLVETYVLEAMPFEEHLPALDIKLLDDNLPHRAVLQAADRREIPGHSVVDQDQRGVLGADEELVVVPEVAVSGAEAGYLAVGMVEDHILVYPVHPGKHGLAAVALHFEVVRASVPSLQGTEPHHLPAIVDDHRAALPSDALLRGNEDVAGGCVVRLSGYLDGGRAEVGARAEGPHVLLVRGRGARQGQNFRGRRGAPLRALGLRGALAPVAAHHVCQG